MADTYFSIVVWTHNTNMDYFKNMLESIDEQEYREFELYIMDENGPAIETTIKEFFPDIVDKAHYRKLKNKKGGAYAYNIGSHFAEGDHILYVGQHDRLSPNTLTELKAYIEQFSEGEDTIIYTDHDELDELDRMNPHFKSGFNKELLLHTDYIGPFICLSKECYQKLGNLNEKSSNSYIYEYILRANLKKLPIWHIPSLLYHQRQEKRPVTKEERNAASFVQKEKMAIAKSYLEQENVIADFKPNPDFKKWEIVYDSSEFRRYGKDYMFLREENVRLYSYKNVEYLYGFLRQPDVAVVGVKFIGKAFTIDNVGYIYDQDGIAYPAFNGQRFFRDSYEELARIPRDVAMVDAGCCLIDAKVYKMLKGFDTRLSGRDAMLDFCLRAKERGYRTIVVPRCIARYKEKNNESSGDSHEVLYEKHASRFINGDDLYNRNLPMGLVNYVLPGMEEDV